MKQRHWIITKGAKSEDEKFCWKELPEGVRYVAGQLEKGAKTGYLHWQLYVELHSPQRRSWLKKVFKDKTIHCIARSEGTREQARDYGLKEETRIGEQIQMGEWIGGQGARSDWKGIQLMCEDGAPMLEIAEEYTGQFVRYSRGIEKLHRMYRKIESKKFRSVEVHVIIGVAGAGKTKSVYDKHDYEKVYALPDVDKTIWFDGYEGEDVLLIDDFYGGIKYSLLLKILDGHPLQCPVKGGFIYANWTKVYITSNDPIRTWYSKGFTEALRRRITSTTEIE